LGGQKKKWAEKNSGQKIRSSFLSLFYFTQYRITGVPAIVFTNSQGVEVYRIVGYHDADMLVEDMQQALKSSNSPPQTPQKQRQAQTPDFGVITTIAAAFICGRWLRRTGCVK